MNVPYFAQWESRDLVTDFLTGILDFTEDPLWKLSGAENPEEYAFWSPNICGMACLKMHLAHTKHQVVPTLELMKECRDYGGYIIDDDKEVNGLYYHPFVSYIQDKFGLTAEVKENFSTEEMCDFLEEGHVFIASVHPSIRTPDQIPPKKGGHLVYVFAKDTVGKKIIFHNPSGHTPASQENVCLDIEIFNRFYAQRGILIRLEQ
ncbi:C39 family peptidase [Sporosarcina sp. Te-1]|uniref:C39 family peptidase n=1 Tax=Sporosarcina sp. Te-1 TaxID=2818390 RepID=UPI001A9E505C|nr:C39 family peptidase [Sporosarcina sp. Te-1]QTD42073.1 C39 family peptidase [Sporosarcina sp. Te-1]